MKVLFLDRDGIINIDKGYVYKVEDFVFIKSFLKGIHRFIEKGFSLIIITNQSGIGRGYYSKKDYETLTAFYLNELMNKGIDILDVYFCPHTDEDKCSCRKPNDGLIQAAINDYNIDVNKSILVGDKLSDVLAGEKANISKCFLINTGEEINRVNKYKSFRDLEKLANFLFD